MSERPGDHRLPWIRRPRGALPVTGVNLRVWLVLACVEIGFFGYGVNGLRNDWGLASSLGALAGALVVAGLFVAYLLRPKGAKIKTRQSARRRAG